MLVFPNLEHTRLLVVGDAMLDRYWFGSVERISPEAPVPVMAVGNEEERAGGAANVAMNIAAIGARSTLVSVIGEDAGGTALDGVLRAAGVCTRQVIATVPTIIKLRCIAQNQQLLRADFEQPIPAAAADAVQQQVLDVLHGTDLPHALVLSDYGKGTLGRSRDIIAAARAANVPVVVDPKGADFTRYHGATLITPNQKEFEAVVGTCHSEDVMRRRANELIRELDLESVMVTRSERGIAWFTRDGECHASPARAREVYDVSGAGDTVIGVIASLMAHGIRGEDALILANAAAGVVVSRLGTAAVTAEEINAALQRDAKGNA